MNQGRLRDDRSPKPSRRAAFVPVLVDIIAPLVIYQTLRQLDIAEVPALSIGGVVPAARVVAVAIRRGRLETLAVLVVIMFAAGIVVARQTGSARFLLAKEALFTIPMGIFALLTLRGDRPLAFYTNQVFATRGEGRLDDEWERLWNDSPTFRRVQRSITILWGLMFVCEGLARLLVVYSVSLDTAATASLVVAVGCVGVALILSRYLGRRSRAAVEEERRVARMSRGMST